MLASVARNALTMLTGSAAAQAVALLATFVLARLYEPMQFGLQAVFMAWAGPLAILATLRLDLAVILPEDEDAARNLAAATLALTCCVAVALVFGAASAGHAISAAMGRPDATGWVWMLAPMVICLASISICSALASRERRYAAIATSTAANQVAYFAIAWMLVLFGFTEHGLVAAKLGGAAAALWFVARHGARFDLRDLVGRWFRADFRGLLSSNRQFVIFNAPYSMFGLLARETPIFALSAFGQVGPAGHYALARTLMLAPATLGGAALSQVFYREAAALRGSPKLEAMFHRMFAFGTLSTAPLFAFALVWSDLMLPMVFGSSWREAGVYASILSLPAWLAVQTSWPERLYEVARRQDVSFRIQVVSDLITAATIVASLAHSGSAEHAVIAFAVCNSLYHVAYLTGICRVSGFSLRYPVAVASISAVTFGLTAAICWGLRQSLGESLQVAICAAAAAVLFCGLSLVAARSRLPSPDSAKGGGRFAFLPSKRRKNV